MISELRIKNPKMTCIPWWGDVPWLQGRNSIAFEPGLNILWGPTGSGKSTIIKCLARSLHCEKGGRTSVTKASVYEMFMRHPRRRHSADSVPFLDGAMPVHDGQVVLYFNPAHAVGLVGGLAGFDWDFGKEGIQNALFKGSAGQITLNRFSTVARAFIEDVWPEVEWHHSAAGMLPREGKHSKQEGLVESHGYYIARSLEGTLDTGPKTILMDEPDSSLDVLYQYGMWNRIHDECTKRGIQVIAASHSLLALNLPSTNYIELEEGYLDRSLRVLGLMAARAKNTGALDRSQAAAKKAPVERNPIQHPEAGDIVRIKKGTGDFEFREVRKVTYNDDHTGAWVWWRDAKKGKGGSKMLLTSWRKRCQEGMVIHRG